MSALVAMSESVSEDQLPQVPLKLCCRQADVVRLPVALPLLVRAQLRTLLRSTCDEVMASIVDDHADSGDVVSFHAFGSWYNDGGHDKIPWLELLDVSKWSRM